MKGFTRSNLVKIFFILISLSLFTNIANAGTIGASSVNSLKDGLVGYWTFDGPDVTTSVKDMSGNGNNGGFVGGATTSAKVSGKLGQALSFDGSDDYVNAANSSSLTLTGDTTVAAWVNLRSAPSTGAGILQYADNASGAEAQNQNLLYEISWDTTSGNDIRLGHEYSTGTNQLNTFDTNLSLNTWYHLVGVRDATANTWILYKDGVLFGTYNYTTDADGGTVSHLCIDNACSAAGGLFANQIVDEVRVYNRALSAAEIKGLYDVGADDKTNSSASQAQGTGRLDSGLTGYWPLDENTSTSAADASTNGTAGTLTNGPTWTTGQIGSAVTFDGTNDYISVGTGTVGIPAGSKGLTLSSFVKVTTFQSYTVMIGKSHTSTYGGWQLNTNADTGNRFGGGVNVSGAWTAITSANTYSTGVWYHVAMTYDGVAMRLYVNGALDNTVAAAGSIQYATNEAAEVNIGRNPASDVPSRYLTGSLDEVRVYNRTLSADEIAQLYRLTAPTGVDTGLKGYWSFNGQDVSDTTAYDRSGAGNTGTLTSGPTKTIGKIGQALRFDGADDYVNVTQTSGLPIYNSTQHSVAFWVKGASNIGNTTVFGEGSTSDGNPMFNIQTAVGGNNGKLDMFIRNNGGGADLSHVQTTTTVFDNTWHHVVWTDNNGTAKVYVDGVLDATNFNYTRGTLTLNTTSIGAFRNSAVAVPFPGSIDEVRVYNRVLSATEAAALYNASR